ncbi:MAG: phage tail protein [Lachnospiraceae bacterium]
MITIYIDNKKIYDPRIRKLQLEEAELSQAKNKAGTLKMILPADHAYSDLVVIPGITRVTVKEDDDILFKGRIVRDNPDFWEDSEYTAEGQLAYLNDTVVRPYEFSGSPREYFKFLITQHNSQVEKERQFTVGRITVSDPNDYIVRSNMHYPSTFEELQEKLLDNMGGYLVERFENGVTYLDYLSEIRENNDQKAKYGENIVDIDRVQEIDSDFATAIIPLGKKQDDGNGNETYLTIASVNDGKDYIQNDDAVVKYGLILKVVEHEDVTLPENLIKKGEEDLQEAIKSTSSITVTAADLSGTGSKVESFRFMKNVKCISKRHGLDFRSPIVALNRNLLDCSDYKITVGDTQKTYTGTSVTSKRDSESKSEEIIDLEREARKKAIQELVSKMEKASGLYVTDIGEDGAHNWYLHDKKTVEESYVIIQVNDAGILFSDDGGKTYNGVSWDGIAILEKIYTIGLDATYIITGILNADIVKIKNLHLKDISDTAGTTLDATLDGITSEVSKKVGDTEIISKINQSAEQVSINADKINFTGSATFTNAVNANSTVSTASKNASSALSTANSASQTASEAAKAASNASSTATNLSKGLSDGTTQIDGDCIKTGTVSFGTESYINKNGQFRVGPMYSSGGTQDSRGYYGNQDVCFDKAIMVNYGLEIYGNNDSAEGISYIDFHSGSDVTTGDSLYDYTGRLQNYLAPNGNSAFTFSGSKTVAGTTVGTCTVAVNGTLVHSSDRRLKEKIVPLKEEKAIDFLMALEPVSYRYSADAEQNIHHGFIYQDAKKVVEDQSLGKLAFLQEYRGMDKEIYGALGYEELIADLIKVVQRHERMLKEEGK